MTKKLFITLLISISFCILFSTNNVKATNINEKIEELEEKGLMITEYDAETKQTREIAISEFKQIVSSLYNLNNGNTITTLEGYDPQEKITLKNNLIPYQKSTDDERFNKVINTNAIPCKYTCRLGYRDRNNGFKVGSGSLVGPNLLLTAAHCIYDEKDDNFIYQGWMCYPRYNDAVYQVNGEDVMCSWSKVYTPTEWKNTHENDLDWSLCVLKEDLGLKVGYFSVTAYPSNSSMNNLKVMSLGYSEIGDGLYQYFTLGTINRTEERYFRASSIVNHGMSGGPIVDDFSGNYSLLGVISASYNLNSDVCGVRITTDMLNLIASLRQ